jgi:hypothetical protein
MTDVSKEAVEVMAQYYSGWARDIRAQGVHSADAEYRDETAQTLRALSAQLEAANKRHAAALEAVATARADGYADGMRAAVDIMNANSTFNSFNSSTNGTALVVDGETEFMTCKEVARVLEVKKAAILALIPASPAEPAQTVQDAALVLWQSDDGVDPRGSCLGHNWPAGMATTLRAIADGAA